jgi:hypothetical protein
LSNCSTPIIKTTTQEEVETITPAPNNPNNPNNDKNNNNNNNNGNNNNGNNDNNNNGNNGNNNNGNNGNNDGNNNNGNGDNKNKNNNNNNKNNNNNNNNEKNNDEKNKITQYTTTTTTLTLFFAGYTTEITTTNSKGVITSFETYIPPSTVLVVKKIAVTAPPIEIGISKSTTILHDFNSHGLFGVTMSLAIVIATLVFMIFA